MSRVRRRVTRLSKLPWEEPAFITHFLTKRDKLLHEKQNVGSAFSMAWSPEACYAAVFNVVTQRSSPGGGALRDDTKNGCVADWVTRLAWPTFLHANTLTRPGSARSTGSTPDNHSEHALGPYQLLASDKRSTFLLAR